MIKKLYIPKDQDLNRQLDNIISNQAGNDKEVTINFTAANTLTKVFIGFNANRYRTVQCNANITFWYVSSDAQNMYFMASGAGTVMIQVWKGGN